MGIYLPNMEMPQSCFYCPFREKVNPDDFVCMALNKEYEETFSVIERRHKDCPLIPVPPHGRLGDIDKLAKRIEYERYHHGHTDGLAARHHIAEYSHFLKAIAEVPTIIPADTE